MRNVFKVLQPYGNVKPLQLKGHRMTGCELDFATGHTLLTCGVASGDPEQASGAQGPRVPLLSPWLSRRGTRPGFPAPRLVSHQLHRCLQGKGSSSQAHLSPLGITLRSGPRPSQAAPLGQLSQKKPFLQLFQLFLAAEPIQQSLR